MLSSDGDGCDMACGRRYRFASEPQAFDVKGDRLAHLPDGQTPVGSHRWANVRPD